MVIGWMCLLVDFFENYGREAVRVQCPNNIYTSSTVRFPRCEDVFGRHLSDTIIEKKHRMGIMYILPHVLLEHRRCRCYFANEITGRPR